ncbi:MAG: ABC transporter ATP-binding protein [Thiohalospira sp.]
MIEIENLSRWYAGQVRPALEEVSLSIPSGSLFGLLGPNGAGKTTLLSLLVGLDRPDGGSIRFGEAGEGSRRPPFSLVPQGLAFYPVLSVHQNLAFFAAAAGVPRQLRAGRIAEAVRATDLEAHLDQRAETLSGGYQRRLNLAIGLLNEPTILFLDEPTVGLDPHARHSILESIAALNHRGMTVIHTSHYMDEVQALCDRVAILDRGRIALQGPLEALLAESADHCLRVRLAPRPDRARSGQLAAELGAGVADDGHLEIPATDVDATLNRLLALTRREGLTIDAVEYGHEDLEALYLAATAPRTETEGSA